MLIIGPWASKGATSSHLALCAKLDESLPTIGRCNRRFSYYAIDCPGAEGMGDAVHFTNMGAQQILSSGLGSAIKHFIKHGKLTG